MHPRYQLVNEERARGGRWAHSPEFADERSPDALGRLLHELIDEGKRVAQACGVALQKIRGR